MEDLSSGTTLMEASNEQLLLVALIGFAIAWLTSMMTGGGFLKCFIWALIGSFLGAFILPNSLGSASGFSFTDPDANLAAYSALGAIFCALVAQVLT